MLPETENPATLLHEMQKKCLSSEEREECDGNGVRGTRDFEGLWGFGKIMVGKKGEFVKGNGERGGEQPSVRGETAHILRGLQ